MKIRTLVNLIILLTFVTLAKPVSAQWTCRTKLPAYLKPIYDTVPIYWAAEITLAPGRLESRDIINTQAFLGLDFTKGKHQLYAEGGWKMWRTREDGQEYDKNRFGPRELYYRYGGNQVSLIAGFHSMTAGDNFLISEKASGMSFDYATGKFKLKARFASVDKDYSRYGTFCSVRYIYDVLPHRKLTLPGDKFGDTNFGSVVLSFIPSQKIRKPEKKSQPENDLNETDEFEDFSEDDEFDEFTETNEFDEFLESDEFEVIDQSKNKKDDGLGVDLSIREFGLVVYSQFGQDNRYEAKYAGLILNFSISNSLDFNNELLFQSDSDKKALIFCNEAAYAHIWGSGSRTEFSVKYYGREKIDDGAQVMLANTNLFIGELARLDAVDMPLLQTAFKHNFPKIQTHIKLQYATQFEFDHIKEYNLAIGKTFFGHAKLTGMYSILEANSIDDTYRMVRLELRMTF